MKTLMAAAFTMALSGTAYAGNENVDNILMQSYINNTVNTDANTQGLNTLARNENPNLFSRYWVSDKADSDRMSNKPEQGSGFNGLGYITPVGDM